MVTSESGSIEQDADIVVFTKRDDYYIKMRMKEADNFIRDTCDIIAKHRRSYGNR